MEGYMMETSRNPFQKGLEYYPVSAPVTVPVYPYPGEAPGNWNGCLIDSVAVEISPLDTYSGQGGEQYVRLTVSGPGAQFMEDPPELPISGPARILRGTSGEADNKRWWDLVIDPWDEGTVILGPDSIAWFDRDSAVFRQIRVPACTLSMEYLPWDPVSMEFDPPGDDGGSFWLLLAAGAATVITVLVLVRIRRRRPGAVSLASASDSEELLTAFEAALSLILRGRRGYLESEVLSELLDDRGVDSMLARRVVRFWKDTERLLTGMEPPADVFAKIRGTALQLVDELEEALSEEHGETPTLTDSR
jgi:hypothetical protein